MVLGLNICTPSRVPPLSSIRAKRRVARGRDHPAASRKQARSIAINALLRIVEQRHSAAWGCRVTGSKAFFLSRLDMEAGVVHAEWFENALAQELIERLPGDLSHQITEHVGGVRVVPGGTRREFQRHLRDLRDHVSERSLTGPLANLELTIRRVHIGRLLKAVGQP